MYKSLNVININPNYIICCLNNYFSNCCLEVIASHNHKRQSWYSHCNKGDKNEEKDAVKSFFDYKIIFIKVSIKSTGV